MHVLHNIHVNYFKFIKYKTTGLYFCFRESTPKGPHPAALPAHASCGKLCHGKRLRQKLDTQFSTQLTSAGSNPPTLPIYRPGTITEVLGEVVKWSNLYVQLYN